eukprot:g26511.t1
MANETLPAEDAESQDETAQEEGAFPILKPHISQRWAFGPWQVILCGTFAALFAILNAVPLFYSDIWGHVQYGQWILEKGRLPVEDPFVPLAAGMRFVDSPWLAQVLFGSIEQQCGIAGLSNTYAITITLTYALLMTAFYLKTQRIGLSLFGTLLVLAMASTRLFVIRTEIFASLSFAILILLVTLAERATTADEPGDDEQGASASPWPLYVGIPLLFLFWGNCHGSFPVGIVFLGCLFLGRLVEAIWETRSLAGVLTDRMLRRWLVVCELAVAATLMNPNGIDSLINAITFSSNPNLRDVREWRPLDTRSVEGIWLALSLIIMLFVFRHSRVRIRPAHILMLSIFAAALVFNVRMSNWYAFTFGIVIIPHLAELLGRRWPVVKREIAVDEHGEEEEYVPGGIWGHTYIHTLVCGLFLWCGFALSPVSQPILGGPAPPRERRLNRDTPIGVTNYFREHPPSGQIWNPQWWGDWLVWDGPEGLKPFMTTLSIHATPPQVWRDYMVIAGARPGWQRMLDKYRVNTIVIHKSRQKRLEEAARKEPGWKVVYEDNLALAAVIDSRERPERKQRISNMTTDPTPDSSAQRPNWSAIAGVALVHLILMGAVIGWAVVRMQAGESAQQLPKILDRPVEVRPQYDRPAVISDQQLQQVLHHLRPRLRGPRPRINHVDHALRFWGWQAKFKDPACLSGEEMRALLTDNRRFLSYWGKQAQPLLLETDYGYDTRTQQGAATSSHVHHTVATLAEIGTPADFPLFSPQGQTTYRKMIEHAIRDFSLNQAMNTGHEGSLTTIHANDTRDALNRLEMMVAMTGYDLPVPVVRQYIGAGINLIIQLARLKGGLRRVMRVSEIVEVKDGQYTSANGISRLCRKRLFISIQETANVESIDLSGIREYLLGLNTNEITILAGISIALVVGALAFLVLRLTNGNDAMYAAARKSRRERTVFDEPPARDVLGRLNHGFDYLILESGINVTPVAASLMLIAWAILSGGIVLVLFDSPIYAVLTAIGMTSLVLIVLAIIRRRRVRRIREQVPYVADLLARGVRAGESLDQAITMVGNESGGPLGQEFSRCAKQLDMGRSMTSVMRSLTARVRMIETRILASTLIVHRITGGNLAIALERMASVCRDRLNYQRQLRAATGAGRTSAIIIATVTPLAFLLLFLWQPEHMRILLEDSIGRANARVARIERGLPDALDIIQMCLTGGLPLSDALARVAEEIRYTHPDVAVEFEIIRRQADAGSMAKALRNFAERIDAPDIRALAALVTQTERMGTEVSVAISEFGDRMRLSYRQRAEERASRASVLLLFPVILCLVPPLLIAIAGPPVLKLRNFLIEANEPGGTLDPSGARQALAAAPISTIFVDFRDNCRLNDLESLLIDLKAGGYGAIDLIAVSDGWYPIEFADLVSLMAVKSLSFPLQDHKLADVFDFINRGGRINGHRKFPDARRLECGGLKLQTHTPEMFKMVEQLGQIAPRDVTLLLIGETGTGKTTLAQIVHEISDRRDEPLQNVACGALPRSIIESELFGHTRGAFTGADRDKTGRFEAAGRGTLLLDEIDVLGSKEQVKLLRVIETRQFEPVGATETRESQARLIVASNVDLEELTEKQQFRSDLYFRLNVLQFVLLPLRERQLDIIPLATQFIRECCKLHDISVKRVSHEFLQGKPVRERVTKALDALSRGLQPFVEREMKTIYKDRWEKTARSSFREVRNGKTDDEGIQWDAHAVLTVMWDQWNTIFRHQLSQTDRSLVSELRDFRNRWAHQGEFEFDDVYRILDSVERLLRSVKAAEAADIGRDKLDLLKHRFSLELEAADRDAWARRKRWRDVAILFACCAASIAAIFNSDRFNLTEAIFVSIFIVIGFAYIISQRFLRSPVSFIAHECDACGRIIYGEICPYCERRRK